METIIQQVGRVERIVSNLLTFARTKKKVIRPFHIEALLDDILDQIGHQIPLDRFRIERKYQTAGCVIEGGEDQLRQVFTNLIVNGLQAMEKGGVLTVVAEVLEGDEQCRITITDNGAGISKELQENCLHPFSQPKHAEPVWDWPSPTASSRIMAVTSGLRAKWSREPRSSWCCQ